MPTQPPFRPRPERSSEVTITITCDPALAAEFRRTCGQTGLSSAQLLAMMLRQTRRQLGLPGRPKRPT